MRAWLLTVCILTALAVVTFSAKFHVNDADRELVKHGMRDLLPHQLTRRLSTYRYINCGDPDKEIANVSKLVFGPDPIVFPGTLTVEFSIGLKQTVHTPVKAVVVLSIKVAGTWVKVPCIGQIGSCTYDDVCQLLANIPECPPQFVSAGVPCQCPFPQGNYSLPETEFDVSAAVFPPGDYHGIVNITQSGNLVSCSELYATFA